MPDTIGNTSSDASTGTTSATPVIKAKGLPYFQKLENNQVVARQIEEIVKDKEFTPKLLANGLKIQWFNELIPNLRNVFRTDSDYNFFLKDENFVNHILRFPSESFFCLEKHLQAQPNQVEGKSKNDGQKSTLMSKMKKLEEDVPELSLTGDSLYKRIDQAFKLTEKGGMTGKTLMDDFKGAEATMATCQIILGQLYCHCAYYQKAKRVVIEVLKKVGHTPFPKELHGLLMQEMDFAEKERLEGIHVILTQILQFKDTNSKSISMKQLVEAIERMQVYFVVVRAQQRQQTRQ